MKRRLVACCDGTWNNADRESHTTNVVRLARSIRPDTMEGISQIVFYHPGVGTGNFVDRWIGGCTGMGLSEHVRSVYAWFVDNYQDGDEIFLFGFSRGAYTARSVAGLIAHVGLLRKHHMENFEEVWDYYRQPEPVRQREEATFLANFPDRVPRQQVTIRCIGVFDTVGSLGIPHSNFCQSEFSVSRYHPRSQGRVRVSGARHRRTTRPVQACDLDLEPQSPSPADSESGLVSGRPFEYWRRLCGARSLGCTALLDGITGRAAPRIGSPLSNRSGPDRSATSLCDRHARQFENSVL